MSSLNCIVEGNGDKMLENTNAGSVNKNNQKTVRKTNLLGNDHNQYIYAMKCMYCEFCYGANGSDIWERKCPKCQKGKPCSTPDCHHGKCEACQG